MNILDLLKSAIVNTPQKGKDDDVPIMASEGEYVIPANVVALLGDGNSDAGIKVLDNLMNQLKGLEVGEGQKIQDVFGQMEESE